uniref:Uncharacterized protein n=1 Tax=Xenopus tropicalis TaxID=8364 RepID=A0A1B8Y1H4_XENTR
MEPPDSGPLSRWIQPSCMRGGLGRRVFWFIFAKFFLVLCFNCHFNPLATETNPLYNTLCLWVPLNGLMVCQNLT